MKSKIIEDNTVVSYAQVKPFTLYKMTDDIIVVFNYAKTVAISLTTNDSYSFEEDSQAKFTLFEGKIELSNE